MHASVLTKYSLLMEERERRREAKTEKLLKVSLEAYSIMLHNRNVIGMVMQLVILIALDHLPHFSFSFVISFSFTYSVFLMHKKQHVKCPLINNG